MDVCVCTSMYIIYIHRVNPRLTSGPALSGKSSAADAGDAIADLATPARSLTADRVKSPKWYSEEPWRPARCAHVLAPPLLLLKEGTGDRVRYAFMYVCIYINI